MKIVCAVTVNSFRSIFDILWNEQVLNEKLKTNDKAQKDFINIAAHELRISDSTDHRLIGDSSSQKAGRAVTTR